MANGSKEASIIELKGTRDQVYQKISSNGNAEEFFLKTKPNVMMFVVLLNETNIKRLYISEGISKTIPKRIMGSLGKSIDIVVKKCSRGRPREYNEKEVRKVLSKKTSNQEKMKELDMPRRTFFYWKKKLGFGKK
ncbi:MAG: hypothetical protein ACLFUZ_04725 [Candidatus Micrarchaeia archaeon]